MKAEAARHCGGARFSQLAGYAPIALVLLVAAAARSWQLSANGFGRQYYAAGVRSMMDCPRCMLFNSFDPSGFVSLDKPPIAIWLQVLSAKLIGFSGLAMLLPQVIEGLLAVLMVYLLVRRTFGTLAGSIAAGLLAITPAAVAVDRSNNMESCLILVLLCSAWAALRAAETGRAGLQRIRSLCMQGGGMCTSWLTT
jgi:4-amino-4-deoxy-L-arabinose transferase-like glycosyltransferase